MLLGVLMVVAFLGEILITHNLTHSTRTTNFCCIIGNAFCAVLCRSPHACDSCLRRMCFVISVSYRVIPTGSESVSLLYWMGMRMRFAGIKYVF